MKDLAIKQDGFQSLAAPRAMWHTPTAVVAGTALVALCAHIAVPLGFTPVPVMANPFAVLLLGLLLGPSAAFVCLALYLLEGALGLPVFSPHGLGGVAQLLGPTGGYLMAYPFAAALTSLLYARGKRNFFKASMAAGAGGLLVLAMGAVWLGLIGHIRFPVVLAESVAPFLAGDAIKVVAAAACVSTLRSFRGASREKTL
jgi:biotin transport system substrate-specific component